ncbi:MAG: leucine-rich repeat domain-containing protein, partial [Verrucomicrobiota bacterium]
MQKNLIQIYLLGAVLLLALPSVAHAQFQIATNNGTITIVKYNGSGGAVIIPDTINGLPVTRIETNAVYGYYPHVTSVTIGTNVTSVGSFAFANNSPGLTNVTVGNSVTNIGDATFYYCNALRSVSLGTNITSIGTNAFYECYSLSSLKIPNSV